MRYKSGSQDGPANSNNTANLGFDRSQSPPPSSPKGPPAQMVTRRTARRQAFANHPTSDHPHPAKVPRTGRIQQGGEIGQRTTEQTRDNAVQSATDSSPLEEIDNATFVRSLVDGAKERALAANKYRHAEEIETVYQSSLGNARLTSLLEANLRDTASPQESSEFHRYIRDARKQRRSDSTRSTESWTASSTPITDAQRERTAKRRPSTRKDSTMARTETQPPTIPQAQAERQTATPQADVEPPIDIPTAQRERTAKQHPSTRKDSTMARTEMQPPTVPQAQAERQTATPQVEEEPPIDIPALLATFCASTFWSRYCLLLPGRGTTPEFEAMTTTQVNDRGERSPAHPAPESWLSEAQAELTRLLEHARPDRKILIPKVMEKPGYMGQDVHSLLAEEVRWAIHHGPFRGRHQKGEIGLLIECVGIERKGTFWKG